MQDGYPIATTAAYASISDPGASMKTLYALSALALALFLAPAAKADSITFETYNATNHSYTYDVTFDEHLTGFLFSGFELTGLKGVTNAVLSGKLDDDFGVSFTSTSVNVGTIASLQFGKNVPFSVGTLTVFSLFAPGSVNYALLDSNGLFLGPVQGPATSPVPEPSTLLMLGTGLIGAAGSLRRKLRS
jgi:hypothetical protein